MKTTPPVIAQRSQHTFHLDHKDMDYYYAWMVGRQIYGGSDAAECAAVAGRIMDSDPDSRQKVWDNLAQHVDTHAETALHAGEGRAHGTPTCSPVPTTERRCFSSTRTMVPVLLTTAYRPKGGWCVRGGRSPPRTHHS